MPLLRREGDGGCEHCGGDDCAKGEEELTTMSCEKRLTGMICCVTYYLMNHVSSYHVLSGKLIIPS